LKDHFPKFGNFQRANFRVIDCKAGPFAMPGNRHVQKFNPRGVRPGPSRRRALIIRSVRQAPPAGVVMSCSLRSTAAALALVPAVASNRLPDGFVTALVLACLAADMRA
jgi:hypothetical protein